MISNVKAIRGILKGKLIATFSRAAQPGIGDSI